MKRVRNARIQRETNAKFGMVLTALNREELDDEAAEGLNTLFKTKMRDIPELFKDLLSDMPEEVANLTYGDFLAIAADPENYYGE